MRLGLPESRGHRRLLAAFATDALGTGLFLPFSLLFFTATTPVELTDVGIALSIAAVVRIPATALAGILTDRVGARAAADRAPRPRTTRRLGAADRARHR
jgi:MFS family permease